MIEFTKFIEWGFMTIVAGGIGWSATFLAKISKNIANLNTQLGILIERTEWHQKEINDHKERITDLERYGRNM